MVAKRVVEAPITAAIASAITLGAARIGPTNNDIAQVPGLAAAWVLPRDAGEGIFVLWLCGPQSIRGTRGQNLLENIRLEDEYSRVLPPEKRPILPDDGNLGTPVDGVVLEGLAAIVDADPAVDRRFLQEFRDDGFWLIRDMNEHDRIVLVRGFELVQARNAPHAGSAPRRPELQHNDFPAQGRPIHFGFCRRLQ